MAKRGSNVVYSCSRSGTYTTRSTGKRQLKSKGSRKCGRNCPAAMVLEQRNGMFAVTYYPTHYGHDQNLSHLFITSEEKQLIAGTYHICHDDGTELPLPFHTLHKNPHPSHTCPSSTRHIITFSLQCSPLIPLPPMHVSMLLAIPISETV